MVKTKWQESAVDSPGHGTPTSMRSMAGRLENNGHCGEGISHFLPKKMKMLFCNFCVILFPI